MTTQLKVFSAIFISVLIIGGAIWYAVSPDDDTDNSNTTVNTQAVTNSKGYELYDTADGELRFTNNEYHYQLTFPEGWEAFTPEETPADLNFVWFEDSVAQEQTVVSELLQGMKIEISVQQLEQYISLEGYFETNTSWLEDDMILEQKEVVIDGVPGIKLKTDVMGYSITTFFVNDPHQYWIAGYVGDSEDIEKYSAEYSKILSTFEFLD